ncbi:ABC transporter ATP-binding protein [Sporanaerobacter sp. PP17-6a]|uniref:ABC transporter ATP-binding protein n=1 Tax=Sporanaerobacter sp. PP17-6a TaxID=1891289 RepID=UPI0008A05565|nr:ABC transporter ATP-binding protein [Sporanaerobacter sp. PP17-6a]SCL85908.1 putative HMP/thiamine import ATP-binding protein YkoD [Sporanaerobacter sp. PP17-6a]
MEQIQIKNLSFTYPNQKKKALDNISFSVKEGEFLVLCGPSGGGKTTLLNQLKREIVPSGEKRGEILYKGQSIEEMDRKISAEEIGMVFQEPETQIVTDTVCHELSFSLGNLGYSPEEMKKRIGEIVNFFGMENKFYDEIKNMSGGQKQILNLASVLCLHPKVLLLDEPTSQLDPVSAKDFIQMVYRLNRDFFMTVLMTEHRLEEVFPIADRIIMIKNGRIEYDGRPKEVAKSIYDKKDKLYMKFLPTITQFYFQKEKNPAISNIPTTVREGRRWLSGIDINKIKGKEINSKNFDFVIMDLKDISFKYVREGPYILNKLDLKIYKGEVLSVLGGNGAGKSTLLKIIGKMLKPQRGKILSNDFKIGYLPQNPMSYFLYDTVEEEICKEKENKDFRNEKFERIIELFSIKDLLKRHPYDLSGGEKQKVILASILMTNPDVILLDEPTKGMDVISKDVLKHIIGKLKNKGMTVIMSIHDLEFAAENSDRCALLFNGEIAVEDIPSLFFSRNYFYTTAINRIFRDIIPQGVIKEDLIIDD